ncbi:MAG: hypothetical protein GY778_28820 [bacterium]|nr:hypothetical protein [bacterium]
MALTLVEASKGEGNVFTRGVIETFIENQRILQLVPFRDISGSADGIEQEAVLPDADSRAVNEAFVQSEGRTEEIIQSLKIYGGDIGIDPFILRTKGRDQAGRQSSMKIKAISNKWVLDFFKGDSASQVRDINGLQNRLAIGSFNVVEAGSTNGGDPLALSVLDEAIARCHSPSIIAMGRQMWVRFNQAARDQNIGGTLSSERDDFGNTVLTYGTLELVMVTDNSNNDNILDFTEVGSGGSTATASSIYIMGFGDEGVEGIQNGGFDVRDLGEDNTTPREDTRVEWYNNFHINHPRSVIRVRGISDAPFTS